MRPNSKFNKHSLSIISSFCYSHLIELHILSTFSSRFRVQIFSRGGGILLLDGEYRPIFQVLILFRPKHAVFIGQFQTHKKKNTLSRSCTRSANPLPCQSEVNILFRLFYLVESDTELSSFRVLKGQTDPRCSLENHTRFRTIMSKIDIRFRPKPLKTSYSLGWHIRK